VQGVGTVFAIGGARLQKKSAYTDNCEKNLWKKYIWKKTTRITYRKKNPPRENPSRITVGVQIRGLSARNDITAHFIIDFKTIFTLWKVHLSANNSLVQFPPVASLSYCTVDSASVFFCYITRFDFHKCDLDTFTWKPCQIKCFCGHMQDGIYIFYGGSTRRTPPPQPKQRLMPCFLYGSINLICSRLCDKCEIPRYMHWMHRQSSSFSNKKIIILRLIQEGPPLCPSQLVNERSKFCSTGFWWSWLIYSMPAPFV
jgi:hypothetical protein